MKSTKTILAVAIVIAGFAYAANAFPPGGNQNQDCCGPQPEDIRMYRVAVGENVVIIPEVEGPNGFIITHVRTDATGNSRIFQDTGDGPEEVLRFVGKEAFNPTVGVPLVVGSTITITGSGQGPHATIIGYVY